MGGGGGRHGHDGGKPLLQVARGQVLCQTRSPRPRSPKTPITQPTITRPGSEKGKRQTNPRALGRAPKKGRRMGAATWHFCRPKRRRGIGVQPSILVGPSGGARWGRNLAFFASPSGGGSGSGSRMQDCKIAKLYWGGGAGSGSGINLALLQAQMQKGAGSGPRTPGCKTAKGYIGD